MPLTTGARCKWVDLFGSDQFRDWVACPSVTAKPPRNVQFTPPTELDSCASCRRMGSVCSFCGPAAWNTLPSDLHDITDTGTFRKRLKSVLFDRDYHWLLLALLDVSNSGALQISRWLIGWLMGMNIRRQTAFFGHLLKYYALFVLLAFCRSLLSLHAVCEWCAPAVA